MTKVSDTEATGSIDATPGIDATPSTIDGVLRLEADAVAVRFERHYATDVADLWSAITKPARLARWFETVEAADGGLCEGGGYRIDWGEGGITEGAIERCRPPHELQVTWTFPGEPTSLLVVQLRPASGGADAVEGDEPGAVLVIDHSRLPATQAAGYGAGWHAYLDRLAAEGVASGSDDAASPHGGFDWDQRWSELMPAYRAALTALTEASADPT
ncbi:MAG TPA: SRPBCC domain-containing protein [Actinomycetales bacterium]|nr:SRPBCC domain-containing protein [Actinomycetales bacterium]